MKAMLTRNRFSLRTREGKGKKTKGKLKGGGARDKITEGMGRRREGKEYKLMAAKLNRNRFSLLGRGKGRGRKQKGS